ncbi:hypothetical protein OR16_38654 [Cupriavidus basilensis OR16]|uniref:Uncharacterized protein n=1 Tax=Cupriavidus basilensis OR16 TaxID=1127483 RepID=H1SH35_9BURK|nr:hypothetical protein OR16_38654 [Cupriavidus basilensis OR16]
MRDQPLPVGRELHAFARAHEQGGADAALQLLDGLAQRGLGQVKDARGFLDAAGFGDGGQGAQLVELHEGACWIVGGHVNGKARGAEGRAPGVGICA